MVLTVMAPIVSNAQVASIIPKSSSGSMCYTDLKIHVQRIFLQKNKYSVNVWVIPRKLLNLQMIDNEWQKVVESGSDRMGVGI